MEEQYTEIKPVWSVWEAACVFILTYGLGILLPLDQMAWFQYLSALISSESLFGVVFLNALLRVVFLLAFISICLKLRGSLDFRELGLREDSRRHWLWLGLQQGVVLFFAVTLLSFLLISIYPFEIKPQTATEIFGQAQGWREILLVFSVVSIFAPFSEELYFRGFLYPALRNRWGRLPAIIITNSIFGILHFDALRFIPIALGGVWLTMLYERTESIYTPMVAHAVWNALMIGLVFLANSLVA